MSKPSQVSSVSGRLPAEVRARAAQLLVQVSRDGRSLDGLFANQQGSPQERGLLRSLVYGTVRWQIRLEAILEKLSSRPPSTLEPDVRALLLVGLFQLLHTDIAAHAAVAETVEAVRSLNQAHAAGFVNAILRRAQREATTLLPQLDADIAIRTAHPAWLVEQLKRDWPQHYAAILDANNSHPPMWLRVNRQHTTVQDYLLRLNQAGMSAECSELAPDALRLLLPVDVHALPDFTAGHVSVQDAAAQLAAHLLAAQPGQRVLDACAAPGGKTCHILEIQPALSELVALDSSATRMHRVRDNLTRLQLQATLIEGDAADPNAWWDGLLFDRILLDVQCSATGVIRRHPDIKLLRRPSDIDDLQDQQTAMLRAQWPLLAPGGRLLYASCSSLRSENADVIAAFLVEETTASDVTLSAPVFANAANRPGPGYPIFAGEAQMDGFYYACLEKQPV
ncbi:MAG: 16S rRNA (cytosine(967)-C(5))-methyltransferase RsmB [Candidatus Obscuribacterales bacterium]|nr:16S rRNA (cytosine(967)-C(5))-methyltransferase RsmB [Steroidobacteraceae bacterium]